MTALQERQHILVVDDDVEVRDLLSEYLGRHGLAVSLAGDAAAARRLLATEPLDLAVVDVVMPGEDGLSLARFIRERLDLGIIMLTSAGEPIDRVVGMQVGADDYLVKPFDPRELLMRVLSVLRRPRSGHPADDPAIGDYRLNLAARTLVAANGMVANLTRVELALLVALHRHPNRCLEPSASHRAGRGR